MDVQTELVGEVCALEAAEATITIEGVQHSLRLTSLATCACWAWAMVINTGSAHLQPLRVEGVARLPSVQLGQNNSHYPTRC